MTLSFFSINFTVQRHLRLTFGASADEVRGYKQIFMLNSTEHEILNLISIKISRNLAFLSGSYKPRMLFFRLINVKMPTIVGILTFMSRKNFILSWVKHEFFYNRGPGLIMLPPKDSCQHWHCFSVLDLYFMTSFLLSVNQCFYSVSSPIEYVVYTYNCHISLQILVKKILPWSFWPTL